MHDVPDGFVPHSRKSPVTNPWEPLYALRETEGVRLGFRLAQQHCNARGMLHGGVIAALADNAMGLTLGTALALRGTPEASVSIITTTLTVDYIRAAVMGQWISVEPRVISVGKNSGTVDALVRADREIIARANASFRLLTKQPTAGGSTCAT
jgi:uncharacterized protein (TIGR00369 family)